MPIEANRKVVPDVQNSALHIVAVGKLCSGQLVISTAMEKMFENLPPQVQLNEQQTALLEKRFAALRKAVTEARKLKDMPQGRHPIKYSDDFMFRLSRPICRTYARIAVSFSRWDVLPGDSRRRYRGRLGILPGSAERRSLHGR